MPTDLTLNPPERNRYFYGLLMDAERFERDQEYFNSKRRMLNRLALGPGVLCGLGLTFDSASGIVTLARGIAIDGKGREIVVPSNMPVDTSTLIGPDGKPAGPVPPGATVLISLAYAEQNVDPVSVLVPDCDYPGGCAPCVVEEGFAIVVTISGPVPDVPACVIPGGFLVPPGSGLRQVVSDLVTASCAGIPGDNTVPLARFALPGGPLDIVSDRHVVYNNKLLFQLITCLAQRVADVSGDVLVYVSGDNQTAAANSALPAPVVVRLVDNSGNPGTSGSAPVFTVLSGRGSVSPVAAGPDGQCSVNWTLGPAGPQQLKAQSPASKLTVVFQASIAR